MNAVLKADIRRHSVRAEFAVSLAPGRITVLFGPSGSGKSTVLRAIAGLERTEGGSIEWNGNPAEAWDDGHRRRLPARERRVGLLFQDHALFPHMSVSANVGYGLQGLSRTERDYRVREALTAAAALDVADRSRAASLSGGEAQRVALARALAPRPRLLLLDEPLSSLDTPMRRQLGGDLRRILTHQAMPTILVTHDRAEALSIGDDVVILIDGRVRQSGPIADVFDRPVDADVARVVGIETALQAEVAEVSEGLVRVRLGKHLITGVPDRLCPPGGDVVVCIRAEDVSLETGGPRAGASPRNHFPARVIALHEEGALARVELDASFPLTSTITRTAARELGLGPGAEVYAVVKTTSVHVIAR